MKIVELKKVRDCKNWPGKYPSKDHYSQLINEPTTFTKDGKVVAIYDKLEELYKNRAQVIATTTNVNKSRRQATGIPTLSSVYGAVSKNAIRNYKCHGAQRNTKERRNFKYITELAEIVGAKYAEHLPEDFKKDLKTVRDLVHEDYLFKGLPFTTFNANVNQIIKYHLDSGNVKGVMSNVLISRRGVAGGELVFPEYDIALSQEDGYYSVFDGQSEIHGVAECKFMARDAYRCSFVFYTLDQMKHCKPYFEEMVNEAKTITKKNRTRAHTFGMSSEEFRKFSSKK